MGIVFLAEQERPVRRKVALKVIKPGMDTEQVVARFEAERQALALMDHPGIARSFDATAGELLGYRLGAFRGRPFFRVKAPRGIRWVAFAPDGNSLATAEYDGTIRICDAATSNVLDQWFAHPGGVQCLKFTRDGRTLVSCGKDGTAKVWDVATREVKTTMASGAEHLFTLDLSHDEKTLLTGSSDDTAVQWDVETGQRKAEFRENTGWVEVVRYSPNGMLFAIAGWDGTVHLFGASNGSRIRILSGPGGGILTLAFTPDSDRLVGGTELGELRVWDVATGSVLRTIERTTTTFARSRSLRTVN